MRLSLTVALILVGGLRDARRPRRPRPLGAAVGARRSARADLFAGVILLGVIGLCHGACDVAG